MNQEQSMSREQFKNLHRVLRKLLQDNGKIDEPYGRRWGTNAGIEEAFSDLTGLVQSKYGYFAVKALIGSVTEQTWYSWTDLNRGIRFENRRHDMVRRFKARQQRRYISVDFLDIPLQPHVHNHASMAATTGPAL